MIRPNSRCLALVRRSLRLQPERCENCNRVIHHRRWSITLDPTPSPLGIWFSATATCRCGERNEYEGVATKPKSRRPACGAVKR